MCQRRKDAAGLVQTLSHRKVHRRRHRDPPAPSTQLTPCFVAGLCLHLPVARPQASPCQSAHWAGQRWCRSCADSEAPGFSAFPIPLSAGIPAEWLVLELLLTPVVLWCSCPSIPLSCLRFTFFPVCRQHSQRQCCFSGHLAVALAAVLPAWPAWPQWGGHLPSLTRLAGTGLQSGSSAAIGEARGGLGCLRPVPTLAGHLRWLLTWVRGIREGELTATAGCVAAASLCRCGLAGTGPVGEPRHGAWSVRSCSCPPGGSVSRGLEGAAGLL